MTDLAMMATNASGAVVKMVVEMVFSDALQKNMQKKTIFQ